ncbi:exopolysaccharide Pel transporter PelG [Oribacterium sp. FC2011]|uniref:exopolysaccharide Pel transporter PelG n=1 Tax=Oribacterium sp. FC2011 TaxID=1408311 RepID=UPI00067951C7|nr:exopolysaccharide Pel transporter PelG [Oribacterium sp. FC2011]
MAGIGFSLKKLFSKKGIFSLCKAYGYSGIVTIGPMLLGIIFLCGIAMLSQSIGISDYKRHILNCSLTYSLMFAFFITSIFDMVVTRYVSDRLYEDKKDKVMPSFYGAVSLELVICLITYTPILIASVENFLQLILCLWFAMILMVVWTEMIYITALKDFSSIVISFTISLMSGFLLALIMIVLGMASMEGFLLSVTVAYGILATRMYMLMLDYFPKSSGSNYSFLRYIDRYPELLVSSFLMKVGLLGHVLIMYFGPLKVQYRGLFYGAPEYEVPALMAFASILISTINFVVSVEVNFYPKYSNYYGLFAYKGAIKDIKLAEKDMLRVLSRELAYLGSKQVFATIIFIVVGTPLVEILFPGVSSLSLAIYKLLCVGYGVYAIANSVLLIELYFDDYTGALIGSLLFSAISVGVTIWQIIFGNEQFYGMGFFAGVIIFYFYIITRLNWYSRRLPYYLLSKQNLVQTEEKGIFVSISKKLEEAQAREDLKWKSKEPILSNAGGSNSGGGANQ